MDADLLFKRTMVEDGTKWCLSSFEL